MSWQQYATYDPIGSVNQVFPLAQGKDVPVNQMPAGMSFGDSQGGFGNFFSSPAGFFASTAVNSLMSGLSQANTAKSAQNFNQASADFFDANAGRSLFDRKFDYYLQRKAPIDEARIKMDRDYRAAQRREALRSPGIAGRYSALIG